MEQQLHFIIGIGRSGTTVLSKLLNRYKQVHCLPEANFLVFCMHQFKDKTNFSKNDIELLFKEIELYAYSHPWVGWDFDLTSIKEKITSYATTTKNLNYELICKLIYKEFKVVGTDKSFAEMLIDKNPSYTIYASKLEKQFPQSKFIWITRDYRANVLSRKQSVFLKSPNVAYNAIRWKLYNRKALRLYTQFPDKVLRITYEDLVLNNSDTSKQIELFLGLKADFETEDFTKKQSIDLNAFSISNKYKDRFMKKYSDLNKPLNSSRIDAWKELLTEKEITICDALCGDFSKKIGYAPHTNQSVIKKTILKFLTLPYVCLGYMDIIKDKLLYITPISIKLNRLQQKYIQLGFITK